MNYQCKITKEQFENLEKFCEKDLYDMLPEKLIFKKRIMCKECRRTLDKKVRFYLYIEGKFYIDNFFPFKENKGYICTYSPYCSGHSHASNMLKEIKATNKKGYWADELHHATLKQALIAMIKLLVEKEIMEVV